MPRMGEGVDDEREIMMMRKKADIETSVPFRSVQEAVLLFGEKILAGQVYTNKLKEMHDDGNIEKAAADHETSRLESISAELEKTKQSLQKAQAESIAMASCLSSLQEELQQTKRELQHLKERESQKRAIELEIEHLKFVEDDSKDEDEDLIQDKKDTIPAEPNVAEEFQKKRYVTFADSPTLIRDKTESVPEPPTSDEALVLEERHPSKKKSFLPLIKGIFRNNKGSCGVGPAGASC